MSVLESLKEELKEGVLENEPLSRHTTFGLGGPARYFYTAQTLSDLIKAIKLAFTFPKLSKNISLVKRKQAITVSTNIKTG